MRHRANYDVTAILSRPRVVSTCTRWVRLWDFSNLSLCVELGVPHIADRCETRSKWPQSDDQIPTIFMGQSLHPCQIESAPYSFRTLHSRSQKLAKKPSQMCATVFQSVLFQFL